MSFARRPTKPLLALLLVFAVLAGAFALTSLGSSSPARATEEYGAEELFYGLYFGHGPVAEHFPEIQEAMQAREDAYPEEDELLHELEAALFETVIEADETFPSRFEEDIQSGDHIAIERALLEGTDLLRSAVEEVLETEAELLGEIDLHGTGIWLPQAVVMHWNYHRVLVEYVVLDYRFVVWYIHWMWPIVEDEESALERERWVHDIAVTFGPN